MARTARGMAGAALALAALAGPGAAHAQETGAPITLEETARETCETGIGSLESYGSAASVPGSTAHQIGERLAAAKRALARGDFPTCFTELEEGLRLAGRDPIPDATVPGGGD